MLPVPPNVAPTISLELDVDDGEVENYEVGGTTATTCSQNSDRDSKTVSIVIFDF